MLNKTTLESHIKQAIDDIFPSAFELALISTFPSVTENGKEMAKTFGSIITEQISSSFSKRLASAIDYYIKSGTITGQIVTVGTPVSQTATLVPINLGNPTAGKVPNTLGIF